MFKRFAMGLALTGIMVIGTGCPNGGAEIIEIWLINDSDGVTITSAVITNDSDSSATEELVNGNIAPNSTRIVFIAGLSQFSGSTATVDIDGTDSVAGNTVVQIDEALQVGGIYPIVIKGDSALFLDSEYVPTDVGTKMYSALNPVQ